MSKVLIVYYSRSGHTEKLAQVIARVAGWDLERINDVRSRTGIFGWLRSAWEATRQRTTEIAPTTRDPAGYDLVVVGTPVWNASVSSPIRSWLEQQRERLPDLAFFATYGGRGADRAFQQMTELAGREPWTTLDVKEREVAGNELAARAGRFVIALERVLGRHTPPEPPELHLH